MAKNLNAIFKEWVLEDAKEFYGYDDSDDVEIINIDICFYLKNKDFVRGFIVAKIEFEDAIKLPREYWEDVRIDIQMTVDGEEENEAYTTGIVKFRDFMLYATEKGLF